MKQTCLGLAAAAAITLAASGALAQSAGNPQWFVPKTAAGGSAAPARGKAAAAPAAAPASGAQEQVGLPAPPVLPQIGRGSTPPAAVIGTLDLSGLLRVSTAYIAVQKEMQKRQAALNADAEKEQAVWREMNQTLQDQQKTLSADQAAAKQQQLQARINAAEAAFKARDQRNQDAANYAYAQINQVLNLIVQQIAESRGMNLVLNQSQVMLSVPEFDISQQVVTELNQVLPSVLLPPDGADVAAYARAHEAKTGK